MINRLTAMNHHHDDMVERIINKYAGKGLAGLFVHGGYSQNPRHLADASSDLDFTLVFDNPEYQSENGDPRYPIPGLNFKSFQFMENGELIEVDMYYFDINNDSRPWDTASQEGYMYSASLVYDPSGKVQKWIDEKTELSLELRNFIISQKFSKAMRLLDSVSEETHQIDKRFAYTKAVKLLVEVVFYLNWEYPPDMKWRVSLSTLLKWKPNNFVSLLGKCNETNIDGMRYSINILVEDIDSKIVEEGIPCIPYEDSTSSVMPDHISLIARLFTRIDKYSAHSVKKCVRRGLPWNAHDLVAEGVENAIDIIYAINWISIPQHDRFKCFNALEWKPRGWARCISQATSVANYENSDDALRRADALRELYLRIKEKIEELKLFDTASLYSSTFMEENLFGEGSPYMPVFKSPKYLNRQQLTDTFAEQLCKRMTSLSQYEQNVLFGLCSHYLIGSEDELRSLDDMHPNYRPTWEKVVKQLDAKE